MTELQQLLKEALEVGVEIDQLCMYCSCGRSTINRWINGRASPNPTIEKTIIRWLKRHIKYCEKVGKLS